MALGVLGLRVDGFRGLLGFGCRAYSIDVVYRK